MESNRTPETEAAWNQAPRRVGSNQTSSGIDPGSLVNTERGLVPIESIETGEMIRTTRGIRRVSEVRCVEGSPAVRAHLSNGLSITLPPWRVVRSRGTWVAAESLQPGDTLYMSGVPGFFGRETGLELRYTSYKETPNAPMLPQEWTPELARFVGVFAGRGYFLRSAESGVLTGSGIGCGPESLDLLEHLQSIADRIFGRGPTRETGNNRYPTLFFHSIDFTGIMLQLLHSGTEEGERRVPPGIFRAPEPIVSEFLRGVFEARGSAAHSGGITAMSMGRPLLEDIQQLLTLYGIVSTVRTNHSDDDSRTGDYRITLHGNASRNLFVRDIGFLSMRKRAMLEEYMALEDLRDQNSIRLPEWFEMWRLKGAIYEHYRGVDGRVDRNDIATVQRYVSGKSTGITLPKAQWVLDALTPERQVNDPMRRMAAWLREVVTAAYLEVEVRRIEKVEPAPVTGLVTDEDDGFILGGIVVGDSQTSMRMVDLALRQMERQSGRERGDDSPAVPRSAIVAGTSVNTGRGVVPIESVEAGEIIRTPSGSGQVLRVERSRREVVTIRLSNWRQIRCSSDSLLRSGYQWIEAGELRRGEPLYVSLSDGLFAASTNLYLHYTGDDPVSGPTNVVLPSKYSVELAEFLGYTLAHGPGGRDKQERIATIFLYVDPDDEDLVGYLAGIVRRQFHKEPSIRRRNVIHFSIHSLDIGGMIEQIGMGGAMSDRALPRGIVNAPKPIVAALLRGYIERRSYFSKPPPGQLPTIRIGCSGLDLAGRLCELFGLFGINTTLYVSPPKGTRKFPLISLIVTPAESKRRLVERIGFLSGRKRQLGRQLLEAMEGYDESVAGISDLLTIRDGCDLTALKEALLRARRGPGFATELRERYEVIAERISFMVSDSKQHISTRRARQLLSDVSADIIDATVPFLREAVDGDYYEVLVEEVLHTEASDVTALVVEPGRSYIAGGIVVGA